MISLLARLSEPSSYAGLGAVLAMLGWNLPQPLLADIAQALAALCALLAFLLKERGLVRNSGAPTATTDRRSS